MPGSGLSLVVSCEHARAALPPGTCLGLDDATRTSQAGWDPGALEVARTLVGAVTARWTRQPAAAPPSPPPLFEGQYTRLWVDLNRAPDHPDVVPAVCYGAHVAANAALPPAIRAARIATHHRPYWDAVTAACQRGLVGAGRVLHLSSHSFCPELDPARRQFDIGVLYDPGHALEAALATAMLRALAQAGLNARANQPYTGLGPALCTSLRARFGDRYAGIELETSHALVATPDGIARVAAALAPFVAETCAPGA